jgi:hypothetical protein
MSYPRSGSWNNVTYELESFEYIPDKIIRNYAFMAYQLALTSTVKRSRHCALILDHESNILEIFVNTWIDEGNNQGSSIHAEAGACTNYFTKNKEYPKNCWMLVIRGNMLGDIGMSRPCLNCLNIIIGHKLNKVVWSTGYMEFEVAYLK